MIDEHDNGHLQFRKHNGRWQRRRRRLSGLGYNSWQTLHVIKRPEGNEWRWR